jgi:VanZ family protein
MISPTETHLRWIARGAGWILVVAITVLSVVPPTQRPVTGVASSNFEHLAIYLATGLAFAAGYRDRLRAVTGGLLAFAALIEIIQLFVPGRHARLSDLLIDAAASCLGIAVFLFGNRIFRRGLFER